MIHLNDLKAGDIVDASFEGGMARGQVSHFDLDTQEVCVVTNDDQECWYKPKELYPISLNPRELEELHFTSSPTAGGPEGSLTYVRGPFSIRVEDPATFQEITLYYRSEPTRVFHHGLYLHELQNHYLQMTKVHLEHREELEN
jgi:hypothetical protein